MRGTSPRLARFVLGASLASLLLAASPLGAEISVWGTYEDPWFPSSEFACLDAPRHRMIAMGPEATTDHCFRVWSLDPADPHRWVRIEPSGPGPLVKDDIVAAAHDPVGQRVFVYQDAKGSSSQLSVYDLETDTWVSFPTIGSPPSAQGDATAIFDTHGHRLVVFGGATYGLTTTNPLNDVYVLDVSVSPAVWSSLTPNGTPPTPRYQMSSMYDPTRNRMLVFGGTYVQGIPNTFFRLDEVWELHLDVPRWKFLPPATTPPPARAQTSAVWDSLADRMLVYGGLLPGTTRARDAWSLSLSDTNGATWTQASFVGTLPESSSNHVAVFDDDSRRMIVHGGTNGVNDANDPPRGFLGSVRGLDWESTPTWSVLHGRLRSPAASGPEATLDSKRHQMVVVQGVGTLSGVWTMWLGDPPYWSLIGTHAGEVQHSSVIVDSIGNRAMVFGGEASPGAVLQNQVWTVPLDMPGSLVSFPALGTPPSPRSGHAAIYDAVDQRMLVFGGQTGHGPPKNTYSNELWELTLDATPTWTLLAPGGPIPPARANASYILDTARRRLILYGGIDTLGTRSDVWSLSLDSLIWHPWFVTGGPFANSGSPAGYDPNRDRMLVTYDAGGSVDLLGVRALTLDTTPTWSVVPTTGCGPLWGGSAGIYDPVGDILVLYGSAEDLVWALQTGNSPVAVNLSLVRAEAVDGVVHLRWRVTGGLSPDVTLERREGTRAWLDLASLEATSGDLRYDDALAEPGRTYDYRLRYTDEGRLVWAGEATVSLPAIGDDYAVAPVASPGNALRARLTLPASYDPDARIEVLDLLGRRVASERIGSGLGRSAIIEPAGTRGLRPGLYLVRLRVSGAVLRSTRMVVIR